MPVIPVWKLGSPNTVETPPPPESPEAVPMVTVWSTPCEVSVKLMPPIDEKYGPPAGALTPFLPLHSLLPVSPDDAENSTPSDAPCSAIALVESANDGSLDSQPPNDEFTAVAFASVRTWLYASSIC